MRKSDGLFKRKLFFTEPSFNYVGHSTVVCTLRPELAGNWYFSAVTAEHKYVGEWWFFYGSVLSFFFWVNLFKEWLPTYWSHTAVYWHMHALQLYPPSKLRERYHLYCLTSVASVRMYLLVCRDSFCTVECREACAWQCLQWQFSTP